MLALDHLVITATTLEEGAAFAEQALGVTLEQGGQHVRMGTHNQLLSLGGEYLEVLAVDTNLTKPPHPRWFRLDDCAAPPGLSNWVARVDDLATALGVSPPGTGDPMSFARSTLRWQMAVPVDGRLPFDDAFPALMEWDGTAHPVQSLPDRGLRLERLEIAHPEAAALSAALAGLIDDPRIVLVSAAAKAMRAVIHTPHGRRTLE